MHSPDTQGEQMSKRLDYRLQRQDVFMAFNRVPRCSNIECVCVFSSHSFWTSSSLDVPAGVIQNGSSIYTARIYNIEPIQAVPRMDIFPVLPVGTARISVLYVCLCVFFPFILDIKFVGRTSRDHTGRRSHRISHPPSFCGAYLSFSRKKDSAIPFPRQP